MKTYRIIFIGLIVTMMSMGYVYQRVEIIKEGYCSEENRRYLSYLADQNSNLMYKLSRLESPRYLLATLESQDMKFAGIRSNSENKYRLAANTDIDTNQQSNGPIEKFLDIFTVNAEAKTR